MFGNLKNDGLEQSKDSLGGGFGAVESDIYGLAIKVAYAGKSSGGAQFIQLILDNGGKEYRETVYITNKNGENFFLNKQDNSKKVPLPGFTLIDDICLIASGAPLCEQEVEEKTVKVYDFDAKAELPKSVPVLVGLTGMKFSAGILKSIEDKKKKEGDEYVATGETREVNNIDKVFDTDSKFTVVEARNEADTPVFWDAWLERNKGKTRDKTDKKGGKSGAPGAGNAAPKAGDAAAAPKKSLFGKK